MKLPIEEFPPTMLCSKKKKFASEHVVAPQQRCQNYF